MTERFSPGSRGYLTRVESGFPSDDSVTTRTEQSLALVVTLRSGERIVAGAAVDGETARTRLRHVQSELAAERFVRIGDELVLRADEVHAVELTDERELAARTWQQERSGQAGYGDEQPADWGRSPTRAWTPLARIERALLERVGFVPSAELVVLVAGVVGVLVAALVTDDLGAGEAWLVVGLILAAYIVSRGISKAGTDSRPQA